MKDKLLERVRKLGFSLLGVADPGLFEKYPRVRRPAESEETWSHPHEIWPDCRSVVVLGLHCREEVLDALVRMDNLWGSFYWEIIRNREYRLRDWFREQGCEAQITDDISVKRAAVLAGLGRVGRNSLVAHPTCGSNLRFGLLLTDADLAFDDPNDPFESAPCGDCRQCEEVCPGGAISDYRVDFSRCIIPAAEGWLGADEEKILAARRIQQRGEHFEVECNKCQKVCPLNEGW